MKYIVVAYDLSRGIGANNELLWQRDLPADLKHFKMLTTGHTIVMGRKTYESIGRALPDRQNIVVSHSGVNDDNVLSATSLDRAYKMASGDIYIIGGASIYEQALAETDVIYATEVNASFPQATVFFPTLGPDWQEASREPHQADDRNKYPYDFVTYKHLAADS